MGVTEVSYLPHIPRFVYSTIILLGNSEWKVMSRSTRNSYREHPYDRNLKTEYGHEVHHPY